MTIDEVVTEIKRGLGYRSDKTDEIKTKLYLAQQELERGKTLPWFLLLEDEEVLLTANSGVWTLPSNFIRETDDFGNSLVMNNALITIAKLPYDVVHNAYDGDGTGDPTAYARGANSLEFYPVPGADMTLYISYYAKQDDPRTAATNAWSENAPELLIGLAGMKMAADLRDSQAQQSFAIMYAQAKDSLFKEIVAQSDANMIYSLGGGL